MIDDWIDDWVDDWVMIGYLMSVGHHQRRKVLQQQFIERDGVGSIQRSTLEREHRMPSHHDRDGGARTESTCRDASWHSKLAAPTFRCSVASRPIPFDPMRISNQSTVLYRIRSVRYTGAARTGEISGSMNENNPSS